MTSMVCNQCISAAWILHWSSAVSVHVSQTYRKMDFDIVFTNFNLVLILILLSFQTNFRCDITAPDCAVLAKITSFEPASQEMAPRYLKWLTDSRSDAPTVSLFWKLFQLLVITCLFSIYLHAILSGDRVKTLHQLGKFSITSCHNVYIISISQI